MNKFLMLALFTCLLLLVSCTKEQNQDSDVIKDVSNDQEMQDDNEELIEETDQHPLLSYFMEAGKIAHFKGDGNENSNFIKRTEYMSENYIIEYEGNGGRGTLTTYRVEENQIVIVKQEFGFPMDYNNQDLSELEFELDSLPPLFEYLKTPFDVASANYNKYIVTEVSATVETHYGTFDNAIVIEFMNAYKDIVRSYLVEGFGEVKREYFFSGEEEPAGTSSIEKVE
ncbi:hypothetical protein QTL97_09625 [Sporosarcina thermotolerans]|uniref:Lipoprotein n=1 Tax=Sporosarcina thermotolerans TaxID=633404 RepID=A0AAW9A6L7_9BACL|nr:hypothetical protein [Sporosarcina thermotolerans]MDW0117196.1 hypothetical protein [Sporosarcina thermotolerans]